MAELKGTDNTSSVPNKKISRAVSRSPFGKNKFVVSLLSLSLVLIVGTLALALGQVQREQNLASDASVDDNGFVRWQNPKCSNITQPGQCSGDCEWIMESTQKEYCRDFDEAECLHYKGAGCLANYDNKPCREFSVEDCKKLDRCRVGKVGQSSMIIGYDDQGQPIYDGGVEACVDKNQGAGAKFIGCTGGTVNKAVGKCIEKRKIPSPPQPGQPAPQPRQPSQPGQPAPSTTPPGGGSGSGGGGNQPVEPVVGYIRVSGQIKNCSGAPVPNVTVTMFSGDTTSQLTAVRTDSSGKYTLVKNYKESMGNSWFSVMAGRDANKNSSEEYYGRVATPKFTDVSDRSRNCSDINCNYKGNKASGGPYRESYVPGYGWSASNFKATFVSPNSSKTFVGMDFEQAGCPASPPNAASAPSCTSFDGPTTITKGQSGKYTINTDGATSLGQLYWRCTNGSNSWTKVSDDRSGSQPYSFTLDTNKVDCGAGDQSILVTANLYRGACWNDGSSNNCRTTGNPDPSPLWTQSAACRKTITIKASQASTIPQAELIMKYGNSLSIDKMLSSQDRRTIRIDAIGKGKYDIVVYRLTTSFRGDAVASQTVQPLTCSSTNGKWVEIARKNKVELSPTVSPVYLHWKPVDLNNLKKAGEFGRKHLIIVNVVSRDASTLGVNNSVCTGNPAVNTNGKACYSNNWCNMNGNRESDGMFKLVKLYE